MNDFTEQELQELQVEMASIDEEFAELGELFDIEELSGGASDSEELSALDAELEGSGIDGGEGVGAQSADGPSLMSIVEGDFQGLDFDAQGIFGKIRNRLKRFLKNKVARLIRKIVRLVRKYSKLKACVPSVTKAVISFKAGKYPRALREGYSAYRCIRKHT